MFFIIHQLIDAYIPSFIWQATVLDAVFQRWVEHITVQSREYTSETEAIVLEQIMDLELREVLALMYKQSYPRKVSTLLEIHSTPGYGGCGELGVSIQFSFPEHPPDLHL